MARFRRLRGSQSVSIFFRNATDLKTLQKQKGARLDAKTRFSHTRFQNLSRRFWAFSNKAKLLKDISRVESRKTWKCRLGEKKIVFGFVFGNFTQKKLFWAPMLESSDPGTTKGELNFIFRHFGADMAAFEVAWWPRISTLTSMSAPKRRKMKFGPPLNAQMSV